MSAKKERRPVMFRAGVNLSTENPTSTGSGLYDDIQTLTGDSTATAVTNYGITFLTVTTGEGTAANLVYTMNSPGKPGIHKYIVADLNSTKLVSVRTASSAGTFYGSTKNSLAFTTGSTHTGTVAHLVSYSSLRWALLHAGAPLAVGTTAAVVNHRVDIAGATA